MLDIKSFLRAMGVQYKIKTGRIWANCVFHNEKSSSLTFSNKGEYGSFKCFGCGQGGNLIEFIKQYEGLDDKEATLKYYSLTGQGSKYTKATKIKNNKALPLVTRIYNKAVYMNEPTDALKKRGIKKMPQNTIKYLNTDFEEQGVRVYKGSIISPMHDKFGNVVAIQHINDLNREKYDTDKVFLRVNREEELLAYTKLIINPKDERVILVEGLVDGLSLNQIGYNALVCYNAQNLVKVAFLLREELRGKAMVFADNDNLRGDKNKNVGLDAAIDAAIILGGVESNMINYTDEKAKRTDSIVLVSNLYKDVNDILLSEDGYKKLKTMINNQIISPYFTRLCEMQKLGVLKVFLAIHDEKYSIYLNNKLVVDGIAGISKVAIMLNTELVASNMVALERNRRKHAKQLKDFESFLIQKTVTFHHKDYQPKYGYLELVKRNHKTILNMYREDGLIYEVKKQIASGDFKEKVTEENFANLVQVLLLITNSDKGDDSGYKWLLNFLAHKVQKPWVKFPRSVLMYGSTGTGKSTMATILYTLFGSNCNLTVGQASVQSGFNAFAKDVLFWCGEEITDLGNKSKTGEILKDLISNKKMELNEKFQKPIPDYGCYSNPFFFSNDAIPLKIAIDDRRFIVFKIKYKDQKEKDEAAKIFSTFYKNFEEEVRAFTKYLLELELWDNGVPALENDSKQDLVDKSKVSIEAFVDELSEDYSNILASLNARYKTNLPTLYEKVEDVNNFTNEVTHMEQKVERQYARPYAIEIKEEENKLYLSSSLFEDALRLKYGVTSNIKTIYEIARNNDRFEYVGNKRVAGVSVKAVSVELVKENN